MQRRQFLASIAAGTAATAIPVSVAEAATAVQDSDALDELVFDSTASLLAEDGYLPREAVVAAAEDTAESVDEDGDDDATSYPEGEPLPLVAADGNVLAFGFPFAQNDVQFEEYGNEELLLNALDEYADGTTVLWDEGHGQFYDLSSHASFAEYADDNGYEVTATTDVAADLSDAGAVVVTSPTDSFTDAEQTALEEFRADGGLVVLMDQSDFRNFDETANLNELAGALDTAIRFNDDQVIDAENNDGVPFVPVTGNLNTDDYGALFADRDGIGLELDPTETYEVEVVDVTDGDTVDVAFVEVDGQVETVRTVGHDSPEPFSANERAEEWEGIDDPAVLAEWGDAATEYAREQLSGETVTLSFDENEGLRGDYGRLLGFLEVDGDIYNEQLIADGYARVYDSGLGRHDEFWSAEADARANDRGLWADSDIEATAPIRLDDVDQLFFPEPAAVTSTSGRLNRGRTAAASEDGTPLAAVDRRNSVAMVGGPIIDESFEANEGGPGVEEYGNFVFLTNLVDHLTRGNRGGDVLIDGGHGQFAADYALSAEDAAYYQRFLEGLSIGFEGTNDYGDDYGPDLEDARALVVTAPDEPFTDTEVEEIRAFSDDGGVVVLMATGADAGSDASENLAALAAAVGTDLRPSDAVTDAEHNLGGPENPTTTNVAPNLSKASKLPGETNGE